MDFLCINNLVGIKRIKYLYYNKNNNNTFMNLYTLWWIIETKTIPTYQYY